MPKNDSTADEKRQWMSSPIGSTIVHRGLLTVKVDAVAEGPVAWTEPMLRSILDWTIPGLKVFA